MNSYIVASNKPWHRVTFDRIRQDEAGLWLYVATPEELNHVAKTTKPRYIFFLHWSWPAPQEIWSQWECVCFHMTDVPYGRGGSPLQTLIMGGLRETKVTALRMVEEMDAGPVYAKRTMSLEGRAEDIYRRAGELSWEMIRWIIRMEPEPVAQKGEVTRFKRRRPEQSALPTRGSLTDMYNHIRMLDAPTYPLAFIEHGDFRLEFSHAELRGDELHARVVIRTARAILEQS